MQKNIPFHRAEITGEELQNVARVLKSRWLTTGKETRSFEKEFCRIQHAKYAVGVNSCTAGLHLSLAAFEIGPGNTVITSPFTFASSANVILHAKADVKFVDVNEDDFTLDLDRLESNISKDTKDSWKSL